MNLQEALGMYQNLAAAIAAPEQREEERLVDLEKAMAGRIKNGLTADNNPIGHYKAYRGNFSNRRVEHYSWWSEEREKKGLQTDYVDLSYTGGLLASIIIKYDGKEVVLGFATEEDAVVAAEQERYYDASIFDYTMEEFEYLAEIVGEIGQEKIKKLIGNG